MRAITVNQYGAAPALTGVPDPQPEPGQVLIRVEAAGMNPMDQIIANGGYQAIGLARFPLILGADVAGIIEATGAGAGRFSPGDRVFGQLSITPLGSAGTYAERVAVTQDAPLARVPQGLDPAAAAALPTAGVTAHHVMTRIREEVSTRMPRPEESRLLHLRPGVPVLDVWHTRDMTGLLYDMPVE